MRLSRGPNFLIASYSELDSELFSEFLIVVVKYFTFLFNIFSTSSSFSSFWFSFFSFFLSDFIIKLFSTFTEIILFQSFFLPIKDDSSFCSNGFCGGFSPFKFIPSNFSLSITSFQFFLLCDNCSLFVSSKILFLCSFSILNWLSLFWYKSTFHFLGDLS